MTNYQPNPPAPVKPNSNLALASLILGILGWTFVPMLGSIIAIVTGHMAKNEIKESMGNLGGDGMATAGLVLGYTSIALGLCICIVAIVLPALGLLTIPILNGNSF